MQVLVTYGGDPIPKSPFTVGVAAPLDLSKIKINGLENSKCRMRSDDQQL
jgi:filamin